MERRQAKESVERLDRGLHIIRAFSEPEDWNRMNNYVAYGKKGSVRDWDRRLVLRFIRMYGPLPINAIRGYSGIAVTALLRLLRSLKEAGEVSEINVTGMGKLYISPEEEKALEQIEPGPVEDRLRILSLTDPYSQNNWAEVFSRYGDRWVYPIFRNGTVAGMLEKWRMSGCVEVRDVQLDDPKLLDELLRELDAMMRYYNALGVDVLRITNVLGKEIPDLDKATLKLFKSHGYHCINGTLVKGNLIPQTHAKREIMAYVFYKQHVHPDNLFSDTLECVKSTGAIWTDAEAGLRTKKHTSLADLARRKILVMTKVIPDHLSYCSHEDAGLYQVAKNIKIDDYMKVVLRIVRSSNGISIENIFAESPFGRDDTKDALKRLYDASYIIKVIGKQGRYTAIKRPRVRHKAAMYAVMDRLFDNFGIFSAENLAQFIKFKEKMRFIRGYLARRERDGKLVKGYFIEGDATLYWLLKKDLKMPGNVKTERDFLLSPQDKLSIYMRPDIHKRHGTGYLWIVFRKGRISTAFRASVRKRALEIDNFEGDMEDFMITKRYAAKLGLRVIKKVEERNDDEIMDWHDRYH